MGSNPTEGIFITDSSDILVTMKVISNQEDSMSTQAKKSKNKTKNPTGRHIVLTTGKRIVLTLFYDECEVPRRAGVMGRRTTIRCKLEDGKTFSGSVVCAPEDCFNFYEGKKRAIRRMLDEDTAKQLTKAERRNIVQYCIPSVFPQEELPALKGWKAEEK